MNYNKPSIVRNYLKIRNMRIKFKKYKMIWNYLRKITMIFQK